MTIAEHCNANCNVRQKVGLHPTRFNRQISLWSRMQSVSKKYDRVFFGHWSDNKNLSNRYFWHSEPNPAYGSTQLMDNSAIDRKQCWVVTTISRLTVNDRQTTTCTDNDHLCLVRWSLTPQGNCSSSRSRMPVCCMIAFRCDYRQFFLTARCNASAVLGVVIMSVRLSLRYTSVLWQKKEPTDDIWYHMEKQFL